MRDDTTGEGIAGVYMRAWSFTGGINGFHADAISDKAGRYAIRVPHAREVVFDSFSGEDDSSYFSSAKRDYREDFRQSEDSKQMDFPISREPKTPQPASSNEDDSGVSIDPKLHGRVLNPDGSPAAHGADFGL